MLYGAIDIGGTKTLIGIINQSGQILSNIQMVTDTSNLSVWLKRSTVALKRIMSELKISMEDIAGIGINLPGMVDTEQGILLKCSYPGWELLPAGDIMRELTGIHNIFVENDVNSCAIGEIYFGYQNTYRNFLWLTVSTGIGGAIVCENRLIRGAWGCAGEIGHVKVEYEKPQLCSCGGKGCLEAHASGTAIAKKIKKMISGNYIFEQEFVTKGVNMDVKGCAALARSGNEMAISVFRTAAEYLGRGIGYGISLFNPEAVIIGGGVATSLDIMLDEILHTITKTVNPALLPVEVIPTKLGYMAALLGAAALVSEGIQKTKEN